MQRALESRGIPTASVSAARDITERIRPPRALFAPFRMGHLFGPVGHPELQKKILRSMLALITEAESTPTLQTYPITWKEARRQAAALARA